MENESCSSSSLLFQIVVLLNWDHRMSCRALLVVTPVILLAHWYCRYSLAAARPHHRGTVLCPRGRLVKSSLRSSPVIIIGVMGCGSSDRPRLGHGTILLLVRDPCNFPSLCQASVPPAAVRYPGTVTVTVPVTLSVTGDSPADTVARGTLCPAACGAYNAPYSASDTQAQACSLTKLGSLASAGPLRWRASVGPRG
eukprot:3386790-Rhodomonas_salina.2